MGMTNKEKARKKVLFEKLFVEHTYEAGEIERKVTPAEVREFLRLAAKSHRTFYHYTSLEALVKMLEGESGPSLRLSRLGGLNDLREKAGKASKLLARTYVASFTWTARESVAMWWMYGLQGNVIPSERVPVRLALDGDAVRAAVAAVGVQEGQRGWKAEMFDVLYQFSERNPKGLGSVTWNREVANEKRCPGRWFRDAAKAFPGFVKDGGWDYEGETRLSVELPKAAGKHICIPFGEALKTVKVIVGPGEAAPKYLEMAKEQLAKWKIEVVSSVCEVRFPEWKTTGRKKG